MLSTLRAENAAVAAKRANAAFAALLLALVWLFFVRPGIEVLRWGFVPPINFIRWVTSPFWRRTTFDNNNNINNISKE